MIQARAKVLYTPEDLLTMPDGKHLELVHGELVEKPMSVLSGLVEARAITLLSNHCEPQRVAVVLGPTTGIRCFPDEPNKVRKPAVSVVKRERFSPKRLVEGFLTIAPDIAVEVVSANDEVGDLNEKVEEYLAAGIPLVWVIDPEAEIAFIHRGDGSVTKLHKNDELTGETILPGFHCKVAELFPEMK